MKRSPSRTSAPATQWLVDDVILCDSRAEVDAFLLRIGRVGAEVREVAATPKGART